MSDPINHVFVDLSNRVGRLEDRQERADRKSAELDLKIERIKSDVTYIKDGNDKINGGINRIFWAVGLAILGAFTTFILSGGLMLPLQ